LAAALAVDLGRSFQARCDLVDGMPIALLRPEAITRTAMLRITVVESSKGAVTLRVEGRITGPWVEELRTAFNVHTFPDDVQVSLDLADISFADAAGIALLRELRNRGVGLIRTSPFLAEQLKDGNSYLEI
jgi:ABC-type transporter Mla MlaB component